MTAPFNVAGDGAYVGLQAQYADVDTIILHGNAQMTVGQDALPAAKYAAGVENLKSGNPEKARELIWDAMMHDHMNDEVLFHWLVAMLSGRTVRQFSADEIRQLKRMRSRHSQAAGDEWEDGVRLIFRLLESVLRPHAATAERRTTETDMPQLVNEFDSLGAEQRDMVQPHLELFLTGPLLDQAWQGELRLARDRQHSGGRRGRAWMFFQPVPAEVRLPAPPTEWISGTDQLAMRASAYLFAAAAGYLGWELLWHGALLALLGYVAGLGGGMVSAAADLERRFLAGRQQLKDERLRAPDHSGSAQPGANIAVGVDKLFKRYFVRYALDKAERERWEAATAGLRKFHRDEIIAACRRDGIPPNRVAWLIRYQVRQLRHRWQNGTLDEYWQLPAPRPGTLAARRIGLAALVLGGLWTVVALRAHPLADAVALTITLMSAFWTWRTWLRVRLERKRYAADEEEHAQRQTEIDKEYRRWAKRLEARPTDEEIATWLESDRAVLLDQALDHFHLLRSGVKAHAFLETAGVGVRRAQIEGRPWRYAGYHLKTFLLAEDGVRHVRAKLDFMTGTLTIRERTSYRYDSIVSVRFLREARRQTFEVRLESGDPISIYVRDDHPGQAQQDEDTEPTEETQPAEEAEEVTVLGVSSLVDLLHILEGIAGEGPNWLEKRDWTGAWPSDNESGHGEDTSDVKGNARVPAEPRGGVRD